MRGEFLDVGGARLYYYAAGSRGAGEPIVLLHGLPTSGYLWSDVVPALPPGHRVVVLDLLGYGRSDPGAAAPVGLCGHADRLAVVLDQLSIKRACLVGHGIGGGVAQVAAIRHPERVSHLCLVSSVLLGAQPSPGGRIARGFAVVARFAPSAWARALLRSALVRGYADREKGEHDLDLFLRPFDGAVGRDALLAHLAAVTSEDTEAFAARLGSITAPTAVLWGADDPFLPMDHARALMRAIPGSTLEIAEGARHFLPTDTAHRVAATIAKLLLR